MTLRGRVLVALALALAGVMLTVGGIAALGGAMWLHNGVQVSGTGDCLPPDAAPDGSGGAVLVWMQGDDQDIYAQRVGNVDGVYLPLAVKRE